MKSFLFFTKDGYTYDNLHNEANNMQILGHGDGNNIFEAFSNFKKNQSYIKAQAFTNVMAIQTIGDTIFNLEL